MEYTVASKKAEATKDGAKYALNLDSHNPMFQCTILAVTKEQFDAVVVGEKITLELALVPTAIEKEATVA